MVGCNDVGGTAMSTVSGYVVAINRADGGTPDVSKALVTKHGNVILDFENAQEMLDLHRSRSETPAAYGVYRATVEIGQRLDRQSRMTAEGHGFVVLDIRADGYTVECFDPSEVQAETPDHSVVRNLDTSDTEWAEATARGEIGRIAADRGWGGVEVALNVDRDLLLGGEPAVDDFGLR
jgi:hypothetical protein